MTRRDAGGRGRKSLRLVVPGVLLVGMLFGVRWAYSESHAAQLSRSLQQAVGKGDTTRVRALLEQGVPPDVRMENMEDRLDRLMNLFRGPSHRSGVPLTGLMWAACHENPEIVRLLLLHGADVDAELSPTDRLTALMWASRNFSLQSMEVLISHGADIDKPDEMGKTPLFYAIDGNCYRSQDRSASEPCVDLLLEHGADVHARLSNGETPLMFAAEVRNEPALRRLIAQGAEVDARDVNGQTALRYVVDITRGDMGHPLDLHERKRLEAVLRLLLKYGADPLAKDNLGTTPLQRANLFQATAAAALLRKAAAKR